MNSGRASGTTIGRPGLQGLSRALNRDEGKENDRLFFQMPKNASFGTVFRRAPGQPRDPLYPIIQVASQVGFAVAGRRHAHILMP